MIKRIYTPYKAIVTTDEDIGTISYYLAFYFMRYAFNGGYVFTYKNKKSAELDTEYLKKYVPSVNVELSETSLEELF